VSVKNVCAAFFLGIFARFISKLLARSG